MYLLELMTQTLNLHFQTAGYFVDGKAVPSSEFSLSLDGLTKHAVMLWDLSIQWSMLTEEEIEAAGLWERILSMLMLGKGNTNIGIKDINGAFQVYDDFRFEFYTGV